MTRATVTLAFVWMISGTTGCFASGEGPIDEIDETVDCRDICARYRDCFDLQYDTASCENRCNGLVDGNDPAAADFCDACLDSTSCSEAFQCGNDCKGILP